MPRPGWYYKLSSFFKEKFGEKIFKIPLDAGFTCPNRDGNISREGCIFCYNPSFSPEVLAKEVGEQHKDIKEQILSSQLKKERKNMRHPVAEKNAFSVQQVQDFTPRYKYLAYFQSFSNTYGEPSYLQQLYGEALSSAGIIGLSIATRPDCLNNEVLEILEGYSREHHIWLELGLQSAHDETLKMINRGHDFACFEEAVKKSAEKGIYTCAHVINGLPGENLEHMMETIGKINSLPLKGIKFHQLQVFKNTSLYNLYLEGKIRLLDENEYLDILCRQLELLRGDIVVHRLLSEETSRELLVAPSWHLSRGAFTQQVEKELQLRGSYQGKKYNI